MRPPSAGRPGCPRTRIRREDAIRVAEALAYDPGCDGCVQISEEHSDTCALLARERILTAAEEG